MSSQPRNREKFASYARARGSENIVCLQVRQAERLVYPLALLYIILYIYIYIYSFRAYSEYKQVRASKWGLWGINCEIAPESMQHLQKKKQPQYAYIDMQMRYVVHMVHAV